MNKVLPRDKWKRQLFAELKVGTWFCCIDRTIDDSIYMKTGHLGGIVIEAGHNSQTGHTAAGESFTFADQHVWNIDSGADFLEHRT